MTLLHEYAATTWILLVVAAFLVGVSKTSIGGMGVVAVALFTWGMPAREATAALLPVLLIGDLCAVGRVGRHADWALLRGLLPGPLPGLAIGALILALLSDRALRIGIGVLLLLLVLGSVARARRPSKSTTKPGPGSRAIRRFSVGIAAGVTTMVANAAGPVMALYLVSERVDKQRFVATSAWFFLVINLIKVPFSAGIGLFHPQMLLTAGVLAPAVLLGAFAGVRLLQRFDQRTFEAVTLGAAGLSAVSLLF